MNKVTVVSFVSSLIITTGSNAADILDLSGNFNQVTSCTWVDEGYFKLPGFDTCLKLGGHVKADIASDNLATGEDTELTDTAAYIESRLSFDTKTQLEAFQVSTYTGLEFIWNQEDTNAEIEAHRAAIELSNDYMNISGGIQQSLYTGFTGYSRLDLVGEPWSDRDSLQATLIIPLGNMEAAFSIEDVAYDDYYTGNNYNPRLFTTGDYAYVTSISYQDDLLDFKLSGALLNVAETELWVEVDQYVLGNVFTNAAETNYAVNAKATVKPTDIFQFTLGAQVGAGAMGYTGVNLQNYQLPDFESLGVYDFDYDRSVRLFMDDKGIGLRNALINAAAGSSYTLMGGMELHLFENIYLGFDATYQSFEFDEQGIELAGTAVTAGSSVIWKPSSNMNVVFGAGYGLYNVEATVPSLADGPLSFDNEVDNLKLGSRIQYVFDPTI